MITSNILSRFIKEGKATERSWWLAEKPKALQNGERFPELAQSCGQPSLPAIGLRSSSRFSHSATRTNRGTTTGPPLRESLTYLPPRPRCPSSTGDHQTTSAPRPKYWRSRPSSGQTGCGRSTVLRHKPAPHCTRLRLYVRYISAVQDMTLPE